MDLRAYYQKIREIEARIEEAFAIVVSLETGDGGKAGIATEVSRAIAAKMVVEGIVRMASPQEASEFLTQKAESIRVAVQEAPASQVASFGSITRTVRVTGTPTLLIINKHGRTTTLTGLTDAYSIDQAIDEARKT